MPPSPGRITRNHVSKPATKLVEDDHNVVVDDFEEARGKACLLVIELLRTRCNNVDHILAYEWIMNVSVDIAWEQQF